MQPLDLPEEDEDDEQEDEESNGPLSTVLANSNW